MNNTHRLLLLRNIIMDNIKQQVPKEAKLTNETRSHAGYSPLNITEQTKYMK